MLLVGTTLFCSVLCKLRRDHFPCQVCAVLYGSQGWCAETNAAMAESLPWLCAFPRGAVGCWQPTPAEHFLVGLFPPGNRRLEQIQKRGGMDRAGTRLLSLFCQGLAKAAWCGHPGPYTVHSQGSVLLGRDAESHWPVLEAVQSQPK